MQHELLEDDPNRWARCKLYSRIALGLLYATLATVSSLLIYKMVASGAEKSAWAIAVSAIAVLFAVPLSVYDINAHLQNFVSPLQRHYIRIIAMVPIYAFESWLALVFRPQRIYFEVAREAYEAYVVYSLFRLLVEALGDRETVVRLLAQKGGAAHFLPPFNWLLPDAWRWPLGEAFVYRCERGVLQYVVLRVALALVALAAEVSGVLCEGWSDASHCAAPWINGTILVAQSVAMYSLVMFFHELMVELAPIKALQKLLAVKAVVFLSFVRARPTGARPRTRAHECAPCGSPPPPPTHARPFPRPARAAQFQGIILGGLFYVGALNATSTFTETDLSASLQNFLICIEMALAAGCHHFVFSRREFKAGLMPKNPGGGRLTALQAAQAVLPGDVVREAEAAGAEVAGRLTRTVAAVGAAAAAGSAGGDPWLWRGSAAGAGVQAAASPSDVAAATP